MKGLYRYLQNHIAPANRIYIITVSRLISGDILISRNEECLVIGRNYPVIIIISIMFPLTMRISFVFYKCH